MRWQTHVFVVSLFSFLLLGLSCSKETIIVPDNDPPIVNNVPSIKIENFINRVFIDLIGREPLNSEMDQELQALKVGDLTKESRQELVKKLQTNTTFIEGDSTYKRAYHQYTYDLAKVHFLEGASTAQINDFVMAADNPGDFDRINKLLSARQEFENGEINIAELFGRMIYNIVYDQINMNSFNFVNASFDNLFWRFPTDSEFDAGYNMVEFNISATLFGTSGRDKTEYVNILINSNEIYEGIIIWSYQQLLSRRPTTEETAFLLEDFINHKDLKIIQQHVMSTDEYANF